MPPASFWFPLIKLVKRGTTDLQCSRQGLGPPDQSRVAQAEADLEKVFKVYDKALSTQQYLAGDDLTLVDIFHVPNASALKNFGYGGLFEKYSHVNSWLSRLQQRQAWIEASTLAG